MYGYQDSKVSNTDRQDRDEGQIISQGEGGETLVTGVTNPERRDGHGMCGGVRDMYTVGGQNLGKGKEANMDIALRDHRIFDSLLCFAFSLRCIVVTRASMWCG